MQEYYILGSGPVGVISAAYLLDKGKKVTLIDNSSKISSDFKNIYIQKKVNNVFSEFFITSFKNKKILPVSSKSTGGFTKIWGGTLHFLNEKDFKEWNINKVDLKNNFEYILKKLNLPVDAVNYKSDFIANSNFKKYDHQIEQILSRLVQNQKFLEEKHILFSKATLFIKKNKIWDAENLLNNLLNEYKNTFKYINNFEIVDIKENENNTFIYSKFNKINIKDSKVFISTGTLTSSFLAAKLLNNNQFSIKNSNLRVLPLIWLGKTSKELAKNTFPQIYFDFLKSEVEYDVRSQLYILNKELIDKIEITFFYKKFLTLICKVFKNRLFLLFIYSHSSNSTYFDFQINDERIQVKNKNFMKSKDHWYIFFKFIKLIKKILFLPLPFIKKFGDYGSFHFGSTTIVDEKRNKVSFNEYGQIYDNSKIHFIDSTVMANIPSGPITITSMAYALNILNKVVD